MVGRDLTEVERDHLTVALMRLSGRQLAAPEGPRCLEVLVFRRADLAGGDYPARAEFVYGEWMRDRFEVGDRVDPEHTLVLAQARQTAVPLFGPDARELLPEIPAEQIRQAMRDLLPGLLSGVRGDESNVLLTLARMWRTARTGEFVAKDAAAAWATPQIGSQEAATLEYARRAHLGKVADDWRSREDDARRLVAELAERIVRSL